MRVKIINPTIDVKPKKIRVCAYCRVSTDSLSQYESLENQTESYKRLITSNPEYSFVKIYHDRGVSGAKEKRSGFQEMLSDAKAGKFDLIITKSISRFARNTILVLKYVRELKAMGIGVIFEEHNINTLNEDGELMLSVLASLAEEELKSMSDNIKWTIKKRYKEGIAHIDTSRFLGYDKDKYGHLIVNREQAKIVKKIYDMYLDGIGTSTIALKLNRMRIPTVCGGKWHATTIASILKNEKYKGDCRLQKYYNAEIGKQTRNNGEVQSYYIEDDHEPIISKENWAKVQEMLKDRKTRRKMSDDTSKYQNRYPLSGMLICPHCGSTLRRRQVHNKRIEWWCSKSMREGVRVCKGVHVRDEDAMAQNITEPTVVKERIVNGKKCYSYTRKDEFDFEREKIETEKDKNGGVLPRINRQRRTIIKL